MRNVVASDFEGAVRLVNAHYPQIEALAAVASVDALPDVPDVLVIAVWPGQTGARWTAPEHHAFVPNHADRAREIASEAAGC